MAAAQEYKKSPEAFAFSASKELLLKEGLKNILMAIKVAEKIFRHYSSDGVQIARQAATEMAAGACYYCEPDNPTGGKLRRRGAYCNYQQARVATSSPQEGAPSSSARRCHQGLPTALPKGLSRLPPALLEPSFMF